MWSGLQVVYLRYCPDKGKHNHLSASLPPPLRPSIPNLPRFLSTVIGMLHAKSALSLSLSCWCRKITALRIKIPRAMPDAPDEYSTKIFSMSFFSLFYLPYSASVAWWLLRHTSSRVLVWGPRVGAVGEQMAIHLVDWSVNGYLRKAKEGIMW